MIFDPAMIKAARKLLLSLGANTGTLHDVGGDLLGFLSDMDGDGSLLDTISVIFS